MVQAMQRKGLYRKSLSDCTMHSVLWIAKTIKPMTG